MKNILKNKNEAPSHKLKYSGTGSEFFKIWILNILMSILTLGIYSFWGKTRIRQYAIASFSLDNDSFVYTGKGRELFIGFMKAMLLMLVICAISTAISLPIAIYIFPNSSELIGYISVYLLYAVAYLFILPFALYSSFRYRLNRLSWRGIRGSVTGSAFKYAIRSFCGLLLKMISFGILTPVVDVTLFRYKMKHSSWGTKSILFTGNGKKLIIKNLTSMLLFIPTFGLSRLGYKAALIRHNAQNVKIQYSQFDIETQRLNPKYIHFSMDTFTGWVLLRFLIVSLLNIIFTLGLATPLVYSQFLELIQRHLVIHGNLDNLIVSQAEVNKSEPMGEGLTLGLDLDFSF